MEGLDLFSTDKPGGYSWRPALFLLPGLGEEGILANTDQTKSFLQAILEGCPRASTSTVRTPGILPVVILTSKLLAEGVENSTWTCKDCYWSLWKKIHICLTRNVSTGFSYYKFCILQQYFLPFKILIERQTFTAFLWLKKPLFHKYFGIALLYFTPACPSTKCNSYRVSGRGIVETLSLFHLGLGFLHKGAILGSWLRHPSHYQLMPKCKSL